RGRTIGPAPGRARRSRASAARDGGAVGKGGNLAGPSGVYDCIMTAMSTRSLATAVLVSVLLAALTGMGAADAKGPPRSISGGDLAEPVALPYEEQPLLHSSQSHLTPLGTTPSADLGVGYEVYDWTWASLAEAIGAPRPTADTATYYPE